MYICICNAVTERRVRECAGRGCQSLDQLAFETGLGVGCGRCKEFASDLLEDLHCEAQGSRSLQESAAEVA
jgi:bacterioferritin-associated ferredoxin